MSRSDTMASSPKLGTFVLVFAIVVPVLYVLCDFCGWALFSYHPATGLVEWGQTQPRSGQGPVMYWYGWLTMTVIGATMIGFLATLLPENAVKKIPLALAWLLPLIAMPILVYSLMPWWIK
jgi:hypothetical protein